MGQDDISGEGNPTMIRKRFFFFCRLDPNNPGNVNLGDLLLEVNWFDFQDSPILFSNRFFTMLDAGVDNLGIRSG